MSTVSVRLVVNDDLGRRVVPISQDLFCIGWGPENDLRLVGKDVSQKHAEIAKLDGDWVLRDLGSRSGTWFNGKAVTERMLTHGDRVELGRTSGAYVVFQTRDGTEERKEPEGPHLPTPPARLEINDGIGRRSLLLHRDKFCIGRGPECDLRVVGKDVSRQHAEIIMQNGGWVLRDKGSRSGTCVNGEPVTEHRLVPGDRLQFGGAGDDYVVFLAIDAEWLAEFQPLLQRAGKQDEEQKKS